MSKQATVGIRGCETPFKSRPYAITHAPKGVKGGPYEGAGWLGATVPTLALAYRYESARDASPDAAWIRNSGYPARVIRIVRARPSAEPTRQPSEASAVEVLRELVADAPYMSVPAIVKARAVLAASGPDPMPVVRAAMRFDAAGNGQEYAFARRALNDECGKFRKAGGE